MSRSNPFYRHQRQVAKWQPSAHLFGRELWRALVRHARDRDTEEKRGRAPVTAVVTVVPVPANQVHGAWLRFRMLAGQR